MVIRLGEVIDKDNIINKLQKSFDDFKCKNDDVKDFLQNKCIKYENQKKSRTYLIFDDEDTSKLLAYFTLSMKTIFFNKTIVSNTIVKKLHGFSKNIDHIPVLLIGQFGKDFEVNSKGNGKDFLNLALEWIKTASNIIGGRAIFIETEYNDKNSKVIDFYKNSGFKELQIDKEDKFLQMYKLI